MSVRLPRGDDADVFAPVGEDDADNLAVIFAERDQPRFAVLAAVVSPDQDQPTKNLGGLPEVDPVLFEIGGVLCRVPFEALGPI
jgi:hypothetical protein